MASLLDRVDRIQNHTAGVVTSLGYIKRELNLLRLELVSHQCTSESPILSSHSPAIQVEPHHNQPEPLLNQSAKSAIREKSLEAVPSQHQANTGWDLELDMI